MTKGMLSPASRLIPAVDSLSPGTSNVGSEVTTHFETLTAPGRSNLPVSGRASDFSPEGPKAIKFERLCVVLTDVETAIIQTESFQRLFGVKQMSFSYASGSKIGGGRDAEAFRHNRGNHSLGVHRVAVFLADENPHLPSHVALAFRIAALVHDIGHAPFSHSGEYLLQKHEEFNINGKPFDHDECARDRILNGDIGEVIKNLGGRHGVTPQMIVDILDDKFGLGCAVTEICDRYDYLVRDFKGTRFTLRVNEEIKRVSECVLGAHIVITPDIDINQFAPGDYKPVLDGTPSRGEKPAYWTFLALRQILFQEYSLHPQALVVNALLELALTEAFDAGKFNNVDFLMLNDRETVARFLPRARKLFNPDSEQSIDDQYTPVGFCNLGQLKDHNQVLAPWFAEQVKKELLTKFPSLDPWDIFFCATPGYSKEVRMHIRKANGVVLANDTFSPRLSDRRVFLVVANTVPEDMRGKVALGFKDKMSSYLISGANLSMGNLLDQHVVPSLFIHLGGKKISGRSVRT